MLAARHCRLLLGVICTYVFLRGPITTRADSSISSGVCTITGKPPQQPQRNLAFCTMFLQDTCCDPGSDGQIQSFYQSMMGVSDDCTVHMTKARMMLQYLFCYGCNPNEMKFTRTNLVTNVTTITLCPDIVEQVSP